MFGLLGSLGFRWRGLFILVGEFGSIGLLEMVGLLRFVGLCGLSWRFGLYGLLELLNFWPVWIV